MKRPKDRFGFYYTVETHAHDLMILLVLALGSTLVRLPELGAFFLFFLLGAVAAGEVYSSERKAIDVFRYSLRLTAAYVAIPILWLITSLPTISISPEATPVTWGRIRLLIGIINLVYIATCFGMIFALWWMKTPHNSDETHVENNSE